jgi:hypothetical protein
MDDVITPQTLADGPQLSPADGGSADEAGNISLEELSKVLGKEYKDAETALKSVKDTFNYVGDVGKIKNIINSAKEKLGTDEAGVLNALNKLMEPEIKAPEVPVAQPAQQSAEGFVTRDQYLEDMFFSKNDNLTEVRDILTPLKNASDVTKSMSWNDFVASEQAKKVVDTFTGYKEVQSKKSVLESNPRLGVATDKLSEAQGLMDQARTATSPQVAYQAEQQARRSAIEGVIEAYGL